MPFAALCLHPADGNDRGKFLADLDLVGCGDGQLSKVVGAAVDQGMVFHQAHRDPLG